MPRGANAGRYRAADARGVVRDLNPEVMAQAFFGILPITSTNTAPEPLAPDPRLNWWQSSSEHFRRTQPALGQQTPELPPATIGRRRGCRRETQALHKHFGPIHAVDGLDLAVQAGEIYGLLGPNGSGKTTLIRLLIGLLKPTSGRAAILGHAMPDKAILSQVGYMTQASALYDDLTVKDNVAFFAEMCGLPAAAIRARIAECSVVNLGIGPAAWCGPCQAG
jgi:ABC-type glutathione transport system ATPase component